MYKTTKFKQKNKRLRLSLFLKQCNTKLIIFIIFILQFNKYVYRKYEIDIIYTFVMQRCLTNSKTLDLVNVF